MESSFDTGKATIRPDAEKTLNEVLALLQKNATWRFAVVGHTDNVGAKAMNLTLSQQRHKPSLHGLPRMVFPPTA